MTILSSVMPRLLVAAFAVSLLGCGGGGSSNNGNGTASGGNGGSVPTVSWQAGQYTAESQLLNYCASPRQGIDPYTNRAYPDKAGSSLHEMLWLRSWSNRTYLWYRELDDVNPAGYGVLAYFNRLKTSQRTDSGAEKDQFHFSQDTAEYLQQTQSGVESGYGISWQFSSTKPPRSLTVAYIEPNSPAANAGMSRGDSLRYVDGVDFVNDATQDGVDTLNAALFPLSVGERHQFVVVKNSGNSASYNMVSADVSISPVQNTKVLTTPTGKVGYVQFNSHIGKAQDQLISAVNQFSQQNISELVVDLRYNGGGLLALASQFGYMVAGANVIQGRYFEKLQFNDKYPTKDPITGATLTPTPFYDFVIDYESYSGTNQSLPTLSLSRVYVLTTDATCSASEAFINGLRGVDVEVIQIGGKTCGKPYGFYPADNCGTTYFSIQFSGINAKGFGDYADGFVPTPAPVFAADVKGCAVADDFKHALGDSSEGMLSAALYYMQNNGCPPTTLTTAADSLSATSGLAQQDGPAINSFDRRYQSFLQENKINRPITPPGNQQ